MQLQGIRIEYFINGGLALLWIYPLLCLVGTSALGQLKTLELSDIHFVMLLPLSYSLGMIISFIIKIGLKSRKEKIRKDIFGKDDLKNDLFFIESHIKTAEFNKELHNILEINLTRQRISRGNILNLLMITLVSGIYVFKHISPNVDLVVLLILLVIFLLITFFFVRRGFIKIWESHQKTYYHYLLQINGFIDQARQRES